MQKVAPSDFSEFFRFSNLDVSPSGKNAVFAVRKTDTDNDCYRTEICLTDGQTVKKIGEGTGPQFVSENALLISHMKEGMTVYTRIDLDNEKRDLAFKLPFPVRDLCIINEQYVLCGGTRKISMPDLTNKTDAEREKIRAIWNTEKDYEILDELPFRFNGAGYINKNRCGLFWCDIKNDRQTLLTDIYLDVKGIRLNREKTKALVWGNKFRTVNPEKSVLYILDLSMLSLKPLTDDSMRIDDAGFMGEKVYVKETENSVSTICITLIDPQTLDTRLLCPSLDGGAPIGDIDAGGSTWHTDDAFRYIGVRNHYQNCYKALYPDGNLKNLVDESDYIAAAAGKEERIFYFGTNKNEPYELYLKCNGSIRKLTDFHGEYLRTHAISPCEHFTFRNRIGLEMDGFVLKPSDFSQDRKYPVVLSVHGGPCEHYGENINQEMQMLCAQGYIVVFCNPRGSTGRGHDFADITGDRYGCADYEDIMDFVDAVLGFVHEIDKDRMGVLGGSYGGSMVNWIIAHTDRFRAAVACRSVGNMLSGALTSDVGYYHTLATLQTTPWKDPESMWKHSAVAYADRIHTPLMLIHSDEDYRCEISGAIQLLTALLMHGVPARMLMIHGENHTLSRMGKPSHRLRRLNAIKEWFDTYLKNDNLEGN